MNLHSRFAENVSRVPDRPAILWGDAVFSYAQVGAQARALAAHLRSQHGLQAGDRVGVWLRNCPEFVATVFGIWKAGGVVVMINHFLKPDEVDFLLADSGATIVVSEQALNEAQAKVAAKRPGLRVVLKEQFDTFKADAAFKPAEQKPADLAALLYTSGTTGHPKGAMLTHGNFLHNVDSCLKCLEINEHDRMVVLLPQFHSFMFTVGTLVPMLSASAILLLKSVHPFKNVIEEILRNRGTILPAVPQIWRALSQMPPPNPWPIRLCISGGAPLPVEVLREFNSKYPTPLVEGYGPTESSPVASVNPIHGPQVPGSVGVPIPNVELSIRDEDGRELSVGATGEICIRGGNVMQGYWNQPEETARTLRDGWLYTGDVGHRNEAGFFFITDRKKDMLLVNGINVYPREIEEVIYRFPGVKEAAVIGKPDPRRGEQAVAFVVPNEGVQLEERALLAHVREHLADYKVPKHAIFVESLPRNATGKILRTALRQWEPPK